MKKVFLIAFTLISFIHVYGQDDANSKTTVVINPKLGFSILKLDNNQEINGFTSQFEFCLNTKLTEKFSLEYGLGATSFRANSNVTDSYISIKNEYVRLPVRLNHNRLLNENFTLNTGIGVYGNYLYKSKIPPHFEGNNTGISLGVEFFVGGQFKFSEDTSLRIQIESQSDLTKVKKLDFSQKLSNTGLISIGIIHNL